MINLYHHACVQHSEAIRMFGVDSDEAMVAGELALVVQKAWEEDGFSAVEVFEFAVRGFVESLVNAPGFRAGGDNPRTKLDEMSDEYLNIAFKGDLNIFIAQLSDGLRDQVVASTPIHDDGDLF